MSVEIKHCTSCGSDQIVVAGNKFLCRVCNIVYEVTDTGTKVLDTNPLDKIEQRLANVEKKQQGGGETVEQPDPFGGGPIDRPVEDEIDEAEDDTEQDGFIIFE